MVESDGAAVLAEVCQRLDGGSLDAASDTLRRRYPFVPPAPSRRSYTALRCARVFVRDGFIDRYSGARLVFPGVFRLLTLVLPEDFPADANWTYSRTHPAYWQLFPTLDHVNPIARGGMDADDNVVTTSMLRNAAKAHWTLAELGWSLYAAGSVADWDGLSSWFARYVDARPAVAAGSAYIRTWRRALARAALPPAN